MKRRDFISAATVSGAAMFSSSNLMANSIAKNTGSALSGAAFQLKYAPHLGMFRNSAGDDPVDQLKFMGDVGFKAFEDNGMKGKEMKLQKEMAKTMEKLGMEMGVFVAHSIHWKEPNLASGNQDKREEFLAEIKSSVEVAKRVNARWMTVVPGHVDLRQNLDYQTAHVVESLKQASAILEPHGLSMVLEPLNFYNHPGLFLTEIPQAYQVCKAVDSPACKILFDIYHQQIQEGNLIPEYGKSLGGDRLFPNRRQSGT